MSNAQHQQAGLPLANPDIVEHDLDILIIGGGMGACGAAYEAVRWGDRHGLKMLMVDKAALERSGAVAQGLSAINTYLGDNSPEDYVRMVRTDLMGLVREDLIFDVGRHVDDSVHLFEDWGLPCWIKGDDGHNLDGAEAKAAGKSLRKGDKPVRSGRWQIMINGESYKCIVAEAGLREALLERGDMLPAPAELRTELACEDGPPLLVLEAPLWQVLQRPRCPGCQPHWERPLILLTWGN